MYFDDYITLNSTDSRKGVCDELLMVFNMLIMEHRGGIMIELI